MGDRARKMDVRLYRPGTPGRQKATGSLVPQQALAAMKKSARHQLDEWSHREVALASIKFVADYFSLTMSDRDIFKAALGLMANSYDEPMIRQARKQLMVDPDFAARRRLEENAVVEAADFEQALDNSSWKHAAGRGGCQCASDTNLHGGHDA